MFSAVAQRDRALERGALLVHRPLSPVSDASATLQVRRGEQPSVGADGVALGEHQDVAAHELDRRKRCCRPSRSTVAVVAVMRCSAATARSALASWRSRARRWQHDAEHDQRFEGQTLGALEAPGRERDDDGTEQQIDERIVELQQDLAPRGHLGGSGELVLPVASEVFRGLRRAQAARGIDP